MFLSRVEIPWDLARNPYDVHRRLWRLFPGEEKETRRSADETRQGFLFRVESYQTGRPLRILLQSRQAPHSLPELQVLGTREFHPQPASGQRLEFLLTANPVKTITDAQREAKPGKTAEKCRVPLIHEDEQRDWLKRKLLEAGDVEAVSVLAHPPMFFRKGRQGGKLATVTFEGVLRVFEPTALVSRLQNGIGPAKAFGCGLLLVRRI
jgi:CRISPR system Cascade subunit CasE